ncbi:MAG: response regulator transcription factor [Planctomycetota bacterium]|jgi:two-component system response regulator PhoP
MRALIVEDEVRLARNIAQILGENASFAADISTDGVDGLHMAKTNPYDLIVLDLTLPGMDGLDILSRLRSDGSSVPVLILTARDTSADIISGLNAGGDDYLTKPFDMGELVARCKALVRRSYGKTDPRLKIGQLTIDTAARRVEMNDHEIRLTATEFRALEYLAMRAGQTVSKEQLLEHLYDFNWERFSNVIEVHVSALRRKLDPDRRYGLIETLRGQGYVLKET